VTDFSAILFDFFGTLVTYEPDRSRLTYAASHRLARSLGYASNHDQFVADWNAASSDLELASAESHVEFSMTDAARAFAVRCDLELDDDATVELGSCFVREWQRHVVPVSGAAGMVRRLAAEHRVGIVSNTHDPQMVPTMLDAMTLFEVMSVVMLSIDHGVRKPHPSIYTRTIERLDVSACEVLFVGDSYVADYEAPRQLGMHALLIGGAPSLLVPDRHRLRSVLDTETALRRPRQDAPGVDSA
jgi:putative hydrolase of the HAD superfamily